MMRWDQRYLSAAYTGYRTGGPAACRCIRAGIDRGDTALCAEIDPALAAAAHSEDAGLDFETV